MGLKEAVKDVTETVTVIGRQTLCQDILLHPFKSLRSVTFTWLCRIVRAGACGHIWGTIQSATNLQVVPANTQVCARAGTAHTQTYACAQHKYIHTLACEHTCTHMPMHTLMCASAHTYAHAQHMYANRHMHTHSTHTGNKVNP